MIQTTLSQIELPSIPEEFQKIGNTIYHKCKNQKNGFVKIKYVPGMSPDGTRWKYALLRCECGKQGYVRIRKLGKNECI